ncbi:uncharacterized protein RAG0_02411 [Rhynchosporium agropyri]|uniref:Glycoside hydrolase family 76 protein n=1 Tax=Rhynchosporium agropyri TaxID=914238 RepID=A0A1E1K1C0_9HELO|nr:uncharacterized protein RAG0_02411 [Rhynchosporium agropyri]
MLIPHSLRSLITAAAALSSPDTTSRSESSNNTNFLSTRGINAEYAKTASSAITALDGFYMKDSFRWKDIGGWSAANVYNDIMDYDLWTRSKKYESTYGASLLTIATSPAAQQKAGSTNNFNDDQLWWCLAMIRAYQNYGHRELLDQSIKQWRNIGANAQIFKVDQGTKVSKGGIERDVPIPADCDIDGAVYWGSAKDSGLNAISTSLFAQVGAWLFDITGDASFRGPSDAALSWLQRMMLDTKTGIMTIDALTADGCTKHLGSLTYETGVYIGALTSLYITTGDAKYLDQATLSVTSATTGGFGNNPALVIDQQADLTTNGDGVQWRDVLFRNLADFYVTVGSKGKVTEDLQGKIRAFFKANYDQIQSKAKFGNLYAANWYGKMTSGSDWGTGSVLGNFIGSMLVL